MNASNYHFDGRYLIHRYAISGTNLTVYEVREPSELCGPHSNIMRHKHPHHSGYWGELGTRRLPPELDSLPAMSEERASAVRAYHDALYSLAYEAIERSPYGPETAGATRRSGELTVTS